MRILVFLTLLVSPLLATTAKHVFTVSYFDEAQGSLEIPKMPNFLKGESSQNIQKGYMIFYEQKIFDVLSMLSFYAGGNVGRYHKNQDTLYSASLSVASRFWVMHLLLFHPYVEVSLFGPTVLSKTEFSLSDIRSNFIFQNYLAIGSEIGSGSGLNVELKVVKYFHATLSGPEPGGFRVPLLLSLGYLF